MRPRGCERGSATVHAAALVGLLVWVGAVLAAAGGILVAHRQAAAAADLAGLAGAAALQHGRAGCPAASAVARANRAELVTCDVQGAVLSLQVSVDVEHALGAWTLTGRARAGPTGQAFRRGR